MWINRVDSKLPCKVWESNKVYLGLSWKVCESIRCHLRQCEKFMSQIGCVLKSLKLSVLESCPIYTSIILKTKGFYPYNSHQKCFFSFNFNYLGSTGFHNCVWCMDRSQWKCVIIGWVVHNIYVYQIEKQVRDTHTSICRYFFNKREIFYTWMESVLSWAWEAKE